MDTAETEKLKALALAAPESWFSKFQAVDGISDDDAVEFIAACSPATVLELIADNERLRAEAERYRWLRDKSEPGVCAFYLSVGKAFHGVKFARETVDEAIGAAMAEEKAGT